MRWRERERGSEGARKRERGERQKEGEVLLTRAWGVSACMTYALLKEDAHLLSLAHGIRFLIAPVLGANRRRSLDESHISPTGGMDG